MNALLKIDPTPCAVLNASEAVAYCGGCTELFQILRNEHGLIPLYKKSTRHLYRIAAIDAALLERELAQISQGKKSQSVASA